MEPGKIIHQGKTKKGKDIIVRYPRPEDLEMVRNYINTLSLEHTYIRFQGEQLTLEEEQKYYVDLFKSLKENKTIVLYAFHDKRLIGVSDIKMSDMIEKHVGIFGLTIAKEFRSQGIGRLLMGLVIKEAEENIPQLKIITLGIFANNPIAYSLYIKLGFKEYGKLPQGVIHKGKLIDHIYMYKMIR